LKIETGTSVQDDDYSWHRRVASLEGEIFHLSEELKSLKLKCRHGLYISEAKRLLQNFETNLALYLYPRGWRFGNDDIFPNLMKWLNDHRGTRLGDIANAKWSQLKHDMQWTLQHEAVLAKLGDLLPDITQPIEMWNLVSLKDEELQCITDLHLSSRRLTQLIHAENEEALL
jgi:hypothetical protein